MAEDFDIRHGGDVDVRTPGDGYTVHETDLPAVAKAWDRLADETSAAPFMRPGWVLAWLEAFGSRGFTVYSAWRDETLIAVLPVRRRRRRITSATNEHSPSWTMLAREAAAVPVLVQHALADRPHTVRLERLDAAHPMSAACMAAFRRLGYRQVIDDRTFSPFSDVALSWDTFATRMSRNRAKGLRRCRRRLDELGAVRFEVDDGTDRLNALLAEGYHVEASGWKGKEGTAISSASSTSAFYSKIAQWAADRGWLRLAFLRLDKRPLAFELLIDEGDVVYDIKGGYDEAYRKWSPGMLLLHDLLRGAVDDRSKTFEWLGKDEAWKLEWSDGLRERTTVSWYAPTVRGRFAYRVHTIAQLIVRRLVSDDTETRLKTLRSHVRRFVTALHRR